MTLPNFLIIGDLKAGTSSLYNYLKPHPEIFMSPLKETRFFAFDNKNPDHIANGPNVWPIATWEKYLELFNEVTDEKAIGEASPNYLSSHIAAQRIKERLPNAQLIVSLRNPADKIYSAYLMNFREGREKRPFETVFREDLKAQTWSMTSNYNYPNLKRYFDLFDKEQIKVILFDDLKADSLATVQNLFNFLEVDQNFTPDTSKYYKGGIPKNKLVTLLFHVIKKQDHRLNSKLKKLLPQTIVNAIKKLKQNNLQKAPDLTPQMRKEIIETYQEDILKIQDLIERDLSSWLKYE